MKVIAVIPARRGSTRLPKKNRKKLRGFSLVEWSIKFSKKLKFIDDIVVSTNDKIIERNNKKYEHVKTLLRPKNLAGKKAKTIDAILDVIKKYEKKFGTVETVLLLQPTSPFRSLKKVYSAFKKYNYYKKKKSVISVSRVDNLKKINFKIKNNNLIPSSYYDGEKLKYQINGNFYFASKKFLKKYKSFYFNKKTYPIILKSPHLLVDIDTKKDLIKAKNFLN
tara:strand:- start:10 stop:675 length:666 start_codon:yes stop_codon:yes gene_type:complete